MTTVISPTIQTVSLSPENNIVQVATEGDSSIVTVYSLGPKGDTGDTGATGAAGANGVGVPVGGTTGQVLAKSSNTDYDTEWVTDAGGDVVGPASATDNAIVRYDGTTGKLVQDSGASIDDSGNITANNLSGTNTGDQTSIVGITGTKSEFNTAVTDGDFLYVGDITQYTDEMAQDAVGSILVDSSEVDFTYNDATPSITASLVAGSIDETKLDASVNASLDLADSSLQSGDNVSVLTNDAGYLSSVDLSADVTGVLPVVNGGTGVNSSPAVRVYRNANQSIPNNVDTKVEWNTETFDTTGDFDSTTNYRWTPSEAGKYQINSYVLYTIGTTGEFRIIIQKNGTEVSRANYRPDAGFSLSFGISDIVDMNGSTDYIEIFVFQNTGSALDLVGVSSLSYMSGHRIA